MTIEIKPAPALLATPRETWWLGDPAVDREASDISRWAATGEGLVALPGQSPSVIRYRAMTALEVSRLPIDLGSRVLAACAYGLLSVEGSELRRESISLPRRLTDDQVAALSEHEALAPAHIATATWFEADPLLTGATAPKGGNESRMGLAYWMGCMVFGATFRDRAGG